jgi:hypothetical protein
MAWSANKQEAFPIEHKPVVLFRGTAGAASEAISNVGFTVGYIVGLPNGAAFTQSGSTVTITGLTATNKYYLLLLP